MSNKQLMVEHLEIKLVLTNALTELLALQGSVFTFSVMATQLLQYMEYVSLVINNIRDMKLGLMICPSFINKKK